MFRLVDMLSEDFPKERLLTKREVSKIKWDGSFSAVKDVPAPPSDESLSAPVSEGNVRHYPVCIVCENGEEILADHVIVTVSLGMCFIRIEFFEYRNYGFV